MDREFNIICGGVNIGHAKSGNNPLALNLWGGSEEENLILRIEDIHQQLLQEMGQPRI